VAKTSIQITEETREKLKEIGRKGESYDTIINRILEEKEKPVKTLAIKDPNLELRDLIKQLAQDWRKSESETEDLIKVQAQKYEMSELDHARYLKLDHIFSLKKHDLETQELR
jgi:predicted CopG family antitoxin